MASKSAALEYAQDAADKTRKPYVIYQVSNNQWMFADQDWFVSKQPEENWSNAEIVQPRAAVTCKQLRVAIGEAIFNLHMCSSHLDAGTDLEPITERVIETSQTLLNLATAFKQQEESA